MAGVTLEGVHKIYQGSEPSPRRWWELWKPSRRPTEVHVVKGADLTIKDGEFVVLVGPSGCGKSTTLRMVAGLEEITEGLIRIDDQVVNKVPPKDRDIAMVFQSYALYPHMTVAENMAFGLKLRKFPSHEIEKLVSEAAKTLDIEELLERRPKELSGGQRQRVAMGRAIVRKPKVFLMDEPLSNLDAKLRVQMRAELQRLHHRLGVTTIYVTHDQTEAMTLGDRIVIMKDGHILQCDTPLKLYNEPADLFVAGFIGSPGMNFLRAECSEGRVDHPALSFQLPAGLDIPDGELTLGIRPQFLNSKGMEESSIQFDAVLDVVEPLGAENFLFCKLSEGNESITIRTEASKKHEIGTKFKVSFSIEHLHFFDAQGRAVCHPKPASDHED